MNDTVERAAPEVFVLLDNRDHEPVDVALAERDLGRRGHRVVRYVPPTAPASSDRAKVLLGCILQSLENVGAPLDDGPPDPELGPVIHAPTAIMTIARQRDDYATASQVAIEKASAVEDVVLAVARAIGLDHEPPGSVEELLAECRRLRTAPASSSAEIEVLAAVSNRLLAMTREPGQLGTVYDGFWSARNMVDAMLTEVRARQSQLRVDPTQARTVPRASIGLHAPEAAQSAEPAGDVEALLREAATFATPLYTGSAYDLLRKLAVALRAAAAAERAEWQAVKRENQRAIAAEAEARDLRSKLEQAEERAGNLAGNYSDVCRERDAEKRENERLTELLEDERRAYDSAIASARRGREQADAGEVAALLRDADTYCAHRHGQVPRMVADLAKALRASEAERDNAGKTILQLCEHQETKLSELRAKLEQAEERAAKLDAALVKVNCIRNSIVGMQGFNFSEHAYPLVAALDEAGYEGLPYPEARANLGTLIEQTKRAEERAEQAEAARAEAERKLDETRRDLTEVMSERDSARFDLANTKHNLECARTGERQIVQAIRDACDGLGITEDEPQIVRVRLLRAERDEARARLDAAEAELTQLHDELQTFADEEFGPFPTEPCLELVRLIRKYTFERRKADAERRAALDVAVPVDVEALAGIAYRILFPAARDEPLPKREESHYFAACCDIARTTAQHVARAMMTERVLEVGADAYRQSVPTTKERVANILRAAMTEALGGGVLPSDADGAEAVARLGIDVPQWAAEVREMVATAIHCKCGCAWRKHADGTLSLWDQNQRPCAKCDNGPIAEVEPERRPCPVDGLDEIARAVYAACVAVNEPRFRFASEDEMRGIVTNAIKTAKAEQAERTRRGGSNG